jgi:hypothetical protein
MVANGERAPQCAHEADFFHVVNPHHISWASLVPSNLKHMPETVYTVSFILRAEELKKSAASFRGVDSGANPAAKPLDFFDNLQDRHTVP